MKVYTGSIWVDAYADGATFLAKANNLSDLSSASSARTNLGLGTAATVADNTLVHLAGTETITGAKTFSVDVSISGLTVGKGGGAVGTNTAVGASALSSNTSGAGQTAFGGSALVSNTSGGNNQAFGYRALYGNTTGGQNIAVGGSTLFTNTTGSNNVAIGDATLYSNTTASNNTAVGFQSAYANTTGFGNTAIGMYALKACTTGNYNTAVGYNALQASTTPSELTAVGTSALSSNTTGTANSAFGQGALTSCTTGYQNTACGRYALLTSTTGYNNTAVGQGASQNLTTALGNTSIGVNAGGSVTTGGNNTFVGLQAGNWSTGPTSGDNSIFIGAYSQPSANTNGFEIVIGNATGKGSNTFFINANSGNGYQGNNSSTWATTSDKRIKENIVDVVNGLEVITSLRPVEFDYILTGKHDTGFIAQEYKQVLPLQVTTHAATGKELELTNGEDLLSINQNLVPYLVKAIQELKAAIDLQSTEIDSLKQQLASK